MKIISLNIALALLMIAAVVLFSSTGTSYAVLVRPGAPDDAVFRIISAAGGEIIAAGNVSFVAIAHSTAPDFRARAYKAGALLVFNPIFALGCTPRAEWSAK